VQNPFSDRKKKLDTLREKRYRKTEKPAPPAYSACPGCKADNACKTLRENMHVCPRCGHHMPIPARERLLHLFDEGTLRERFANVAARDPLSFPGYAEKTAKLRASAGVAEACFCAMGQIAGHKAVCAAHDTGFMMGSMGTAVGEKISRCAELARSSKMPLIIFCAGGGARMQEGIFSLMQMAKTSAAVRRFSDSGGLFISVITHPTTGGITASYASLGDIILAEPGALFGFAGPRVIEQTIGETLPEGFQRSEFQMEHGFVDAIVAREDMRGTLIRLMKLHERRKVVVS